MKKLAELTRYLIELDLIAVESIDSWAEDPRILPSGKRIGADSIVLYRQTYDAVISISRYPHKEHPAELLFAQICAWLLNNDGARDEIAAPRTDIDIIDDQVADIEITIDFEEDVTGVADPAGPIVIGGTRYRLADPSIDYAQTGDLAA